MKLREFFDDRLNPIVVKELRQAVQGRFIAAVLFFFLLIQLGTLVIHLLTSDIETVNVISDEGYGRPVFGIILAVLLFMTILVVPTYAGVRLYMERGGDNFSLLFITTLPPRRVIAGKLLSNLVVALLLFSACMPFVSFTYFLRGIDLPSILVVLAFDFVVVVTAIQTTIFLACLPAGRFLKILLGLAGLGGLSMVLTGATAASVEMVEQGVASQLGTRDFWLTAGSFLGMSAFAVVLFFLISVALISPPMANRAPPVRLFLTFSWLLSGALAVYATQRVRDSGPIVVWFYIWCVVAAGGFFIAINARDRLSTRAALKVPRSLVKRALYFFFWSGSANGMAWSVVIAALTLGCGRAMVLSTGTSLSHDWERALALAGYGFAYVVTGLLLHRRFLARRLSHANTWVLVLLLTATGALAPPILGFLADPEHFSRTSHQMRWTFLNPFAVFNTNSTSETAAFSLTWAAVAAVAALPWFLRQVRNFRPPPATDPGN